MHIRHNAKGFAVSLNGRFVGARLEARSLGTNMARYVADKNCLVRDWLGRSKPHLTRGQVLSSLDGCRRRNGPNQ